VIRHLELSKLAAAEPPAMTTLFIPPATVPRDDPEMMERLGMPALSVSG